MISELTDFSRSMMLSITIQPSSGLIQSPEALYRMLKEELNK